MVMNMIAKGYRMGIDFGSTTAKAVVVDNENHPVYTRYQRHNADIMPLLYQFLSDAKNQLGDIELSLAITGSVGMGISERIEIPFVQEVIAASRFIRTLHPDISTLIDIGGEDAKIVYLKPDGTADLRMNGNCAGGTGAFIDQMAILLGVDTHELDRLAAEATHLHPIASRCGVFSKTDVQNLISKNVSKADIAASIFHAVAVQTVVTLSHGYEIKPKILFCGGPLSFIPSLRKAFINYLKINDTDIVVPENGELIPAFGTALSADAGRAIAISELIKRVQTQLHTPVGRTAQSLPCLFASEEEYANWKEQKGTLRITRTDTTPQEVFLGIDSGSTTTKIVAIDEHGHLAFSYYAGNNGDPITAVKKGLTEWLDSCRNTGTIPSIRSAYSTGYGEDLIKTAFRLNGSTIETIAHYKAAHEIDPDVSFILDIGGQDMKALFVENGILSRMEINEACSSGCGSFIETFSRSLNHPVAEFARMAALAQNPCDLGTRCTVFMNSKVKQALREGATIDDIAAGLSYSVVKNCLYKVLKLRDTAELGDHIVLQGGTMRNDSIARAFELLTGKNIRRSNIPELMGAYGCALLAREDQGKTAVKLTSLVSASDYRSGNTQCRGCENQCYIQKYTFSNGSIFYSGNKCERIFSNRGEKTQKGHNIYTDKYALLFDRAKTTGAASPVPTVAFRALFNPPAQLALENVQVIGLPRSLNMYEEFPFWHTLFNEAGFRTVLSDPSTYRRYEQGVHSVMSDNICFPAKLVHSHIYDLIDKKVNRIFLPYVIFEKQDDKQMRNSFNCPIVTGYSDVIKSVIHTGIPIDSPTVSFKDEKLLHKACTEYLASLGVPHARIRTAIKKATEAQQEYENQIAEINRKQYNRNRSKQKLTLLLAGRPYHTDPLVQHKLSEMIADMGVDVITDDIVRNHADVTVDDSYLVSQWAYINRILKAAEWVAQQGEDVHFVQMTSFGCGPDAFLLDEVRSILNRHGKTLTLLKIDDVNNIGSIKLRVRSLVECLKYNRDRQSKKEPFHTTRIFTAQEKKRKILAPYFTDFISPLIPAVFQLAGYEVECLPESDTESAECGLKYANNEVCYPATLIVGDLIKALASGKYDLNETAVAITQTGGQCRATNYIGLIKKAMVDAGFADVPVISVAFSDGLTNEQPGFNIPWLKILPITLAALLYSDCIAQFYYAALAREEHPGDADRLRDRYLDEAQAIILQNKPDRLYDKIGEAALAFGKIAVNEAPLHKVGIVGEIFLKFNSFAHKHVVRWLTENRIEVIPPQLTSFFMQGFVNRKVRKQCHIARSYLPEVLADAAYALIRRQIKKVNTIASQFDGFIPFPDIFEEAENGKQIVSLSAQFGEGWALPAEIVSFAKQGIHNVVSLQPFGCIANHIVSKGVEKKIKTLYPQMNLLSLDFDSGVSDANIINRLLLFTNNMK